MMDSNFNLHTVSLFVLLAAFLKTCFHVRQDADQHLNADGPHSADICSASFYKENPTTRSEQQQKGWFWLSKSLCGETEPTLRSVWRGRRSELTHPAYRTLTESLFKWSQNVRIPVSNQLSFRKTLWWEIYNLEVVLPGTRKSRLTEHQESKPTFLCVCFSKLTKKAFLCGQVFTFLNLQECSNMLRCNVGSHRMYHAVNVPPQTNRKLWFLTAATATHLICFNVSGRCSSSNSIATTVQKLSRGSLLVRTMRLFQRI